MKEEEDPEFADNLITALGLKSITLRPKAPPGERETSFLGVTGIHGRSVFSTRNRKLVRRALASVPPPETLHEFTSCLATVAADSPCEEADAILEAAREATAEAPELPLTEFVRGQVD